MCNGCADGCPLKNGKRRQARHTNTSPTSPIRPPIPPSTFSVLYTVGNLPRCTLSPSAGPTAVPSLPATHLFSFWSTNPAEPFRPLASGISDAGEPEPRLGISFGDYLGRASSLPLAEHLERHGGQPARPFREAGLLKRGSGSPSPATRLLRSLSFRSPPATTRTGRVPELRSENVVLSAWKGTSCGENEKGVWRQGA